ncbi:cyclic nucleotide-binding domain-containing protein [Nocardioides marmoriginsengisoli]|uniref:Cyclic nucleotide-binding domain-containing protein n=1 Tax=Nocardioides marmoriginsengisoli TaxID=661483 RepID=A0A3N0CHL5_9ACTN|nr:cyclic nucleotide-binding domain-containing protein [Nocardioides marmoriginsengisoli]RNL62928.1 cyclic nucleotide-binding domain-containing protein [Nocardioides marmoriginsengisoli]
MRLHKDAKTELIRSLPLFADCTPGEVAEVAAIADEIDLRSGLRLATEKADGQEFVVIIEGTADVTQGDAVINTLRSGDFFGEIALVTGEPRTASVIATSDVHALVIEGHAFRRLLEDAPDIDAKVRRAVAERT